MKKKYISLNDLLSDERFVKWVKSQESADDLYWKTWLDNHPDCIDIFHEARQIILSVKFHSQKASSETVSRIYDNVLLERTAIPSKPKRPSYLVAASLIIISLLVMWLYLDKQNDQNTTLAEVGQIKSILKESPNGAKITFQLSDGSTIKMNAGSSLRTAENFGVQERAVFLEGEAFFEIEKDEKRPFIIHTGGLKTIVRGTSFNIGAYQNHEDIRVAVTEGNVEVIMKNGGSYDTISLKPSDMVVYDKNTERFEKVKFDPLAVLGWKEGIIYFENASCDEMFPYLERWYGVEFIVHGQHELPDDFIGEFKNESLENVLRVMGNALGFSYQIENKKVHIKPK